MRHFYYDLFQFIHGLKSVRGKSIESGLVNELDQERSSASTLDEFSGGLGVHGEVGRGETGGLRLSSRDGIGDTLVIQRIERLRIDLQHKSDCGASRNPDEITGNKAVLHTVVILVNGVNRGSGSVLGKIRDGGSVAKNVGVDGVSKKLGDVADGDTTRQVTDVVTGNSLGLTVQKSLERGTSEVITSINGELRSSSKQR